MEEPITPSSSAAGAAAELKIRNENGGPKPLLPSTPAPSALSTIKTTGTIVDFLNFNDADWESSLKFGVSEFAEDAYIAPPPGKRFAWEGRGVVADDVPFECDDGAGGDAWLYCDTVVNPCTKEVGERYERQQFDYHPFTEFHRLTALLEDVRKFNESEESEENSVTAGTAKNAMERIYGTILIDEESEDDDEMTRRIQDVEKLLEQNSATLSESEILDRLADCEVSLEPLKAEQELQELINLKYSLQDRQKFSCVHPSAADGEWFLVPRGNLKKSYTSQVLKNLHLFDPKFELCFKPPYRIFSSSGGSEDEGIPKALSNALLRLLNEFPHGVAPHVIWEKFFKMKGYLPKLHNLSNKKLLECHAEELYFAHERPIPELVFPGFLEGITSPELILRRVWHSIMCILGRKPAIPILDIFPPIEEEYGFNFDPLDWGYKTVTDFISFCLRYFGMEGPLTIHGVQYQEDHVPKCVEYLMVNSAYLIAFTEELYGVRRQDIQESDIFSGVPRDFMAEGDNIPFVSNACSPIDTAIATLYEAKDPSRMFVVRHEEDVMVERFQMKINDYEERIKYHNQKIQIPSVLKPGMYAMVFLPVWFEKRSNYFRARIINNYQAEKKALVYGIDAGFLRWVPYRDVRFMPKEYKVVPAAAIPVELDIAHPMKRKWDTDITSSILYSVVGNNRLNIQLIKSTHNLALGCKRWLIQCGVVESFENPTVIYDSLSVKFLDVFKSIMLDREEKRRARKKKGKNETVQEVEVPKDETSLVTEETEEKEEAKTEGAK